MSERHPGRPGKTEWEQCKIEGCQNTCKGSGFGMCRTHYMQVHRGMRAQDGTLLRERQRVATYGEGARCLVPGCLSRPAALGLCAGHYQQRSSGVDLGVEVPLQGYGSKTARVSCCVVPQCEKRPVNRGMCSTHTQQRASGLIDDQGNQLREKKAWRRPRTTERWLMADGYVLIEAPEGHPRARHDGSVLEHRHVVEQYLGRYIEDWEIVHHKDGNRQNNIISNLELLDGRARKSEGHPPGHEVSSGELMRGLEQLRLNDPEAYSQLMQDLGG